MWLRLMCLQEAPGSQGCAEATCRAALELLVTIRKIVLHVVLTSGCVARITSACQEVGLQTTLIHIHHDFMRRGSCGQAG